MFEDIEIEKKGFTAIRLFFKESKFEKRCFCFYYNVS